MSKLHSPVSFHFLAPCALQNRGSLKLFIGSVFKREKRRLKTLNIIFCSDEYLLNLNRQFLKHDFYTDILSFPLSPRGQALEAEIYISVERVKENAQNTDLSFKEEIHRVVFHGVLHFCGFKDKSPGEIRQMRDKEEELLKRYALSLKRKA